MGYQDDLVKKVHEKALVATVGAVRLNGKPMGALDDGSHVILAATEKLLELIEADGTECLLEDLDPPPAGGLWVLECNVTEDPEDRLIDTGWRIPLQAELHQFLNRQALRATIKEWLRKDSDPGEESWTFLGARV